MVHRSGNERSCYSCHISSSVPRSSFYFIATNDHYATDALPLEVGMGRRGHRPTAVVELDTQGRTLQQRSHKHLGVRIGDVASHLTHTAVADPSLRFHAHSPPHTDQVVQAVRLERPVHLIEGQWDPRNLTSSLLRWLNVVVVGRVVIARRFAVGSVDGGPEQRRAATAGNGLRPAGRPFKL